jgi:hypothetical protein
VDISDAGVSADKQIATRIRDAEPVKVLPDILAFLQKETELTRHTLAEILKRSGRLGEFKINPQAFMAAVAKEISRALHDLMLEGIKYEKVAGTYWEQSRIEQDAEEGIVRYLSNLYEVQNREKSLFDAVEYESEVEKQFARDLVTRTSNSSSSCRHGSRSIRRSAVTIRIGLLSRSGKKSSTSCAKPRAPSTTKNAAPRKTKRSPAAASISILLAWITMWSPRYPRSRCDHGDVTRKRGKRSPSKTGLIPSVECIFLRLFLVLLLPD